MESDIEIIDPKSFAAVIAEELAASIADILDEQESCSLVLSGGSTPAKLYRRLGRPPFNNDINWSQMKVFWGDERWVPQDSEQSNYRMAHETFLSSVEEKGAKYFPIDTSQSSPEKGAQAYEDTIKSEGYYTDGDSPNFDIVLLGMGTDGHTASLFPGNKDIHTKDKLCIATKNTSDDTTRISLTSTALFQAKRVFFLVAGEEKAETVEKVIENNSTTIDEAPATLYREATGRVTWFCDSLAAARISTS